MRRNLYNWAFAAGVLLLWVACSSEPGDASSPDSPAIRFAVSPVAGASGETRAVLSGSYLPEADEVGIFAFSYTTPSPVWQSSPDLFDNVKGTVGACPSGGDPQEVTIAPGLGKYYVSGRTHAFYSYYPYREALSASARSITSDLFDVSGTDAQTDWLWASVTGVMPSAAPVGFTYSHVMSMIRVAVAKWASVNATLRLESLTVTTSTSQQFTFDVSTGAVTGVTGGATSYLFDAENFSIPPLGVGETLATQMAAEVLLLPASDITALSFRVNGEDFSTPATWSGFSTSPAGKFKLVSIVIGVSEIVIQLGGQDWTDDDPIDLTQSGVTISLGAKDWGYDPATDTDLTKSTVSISLGAKAWLNGGKIIVN